MNLRFTPAINGKECGRSIEVKRSYFPDEYKELSKGEENEYDFGVLELEEEQENHYGFLGIDMGESNIKEVNEI